MNQPIDQIPSDLRDKLPDDARELYVATYNRVLEKGPHSEAMSKVRMRQRAHEGAMLAVQSEFEPGEDGCWHRAPIGKDMEHIGPAADEEARAVLRSADDE